VEIFHEGLAHFEKRNWEQAAVSFEKALLINADDNPSKIYKERCAEFLKKPPSNNWDGVYNLTAK
jgi:adenylate cyclase